MLWFEVTTGVFVPDGLQRGSPLLRSPTIAASVAVFRKAFFRVLHEHFHPEDHEFFTLAGTTSHVARAAALAGKLPTARAAPLMPSETYNVIFRRLIALHPGFHQDWLRLLEEGTLLLRPAEAALQLPPAGPRQAGAVRTVTADGAHAAQPGFTIVCPAPACHMPIVLNDKPVRTVGAWPKVKCTSCSRALRVGRATCAACTRLLPACACSCTAASAAPA